MHYHFPAKISTGQSPRTLQALLNRSKNIVIPAMDSRDPKTGMEGRYNEHLAVHGIGSRPSLAGMTYFL